MRIDGGGFTPETGEGYSDYGSIGSYFIEGTLGIPELAAVAGGPYVIDEGQSLQLVGGSSLGTDEAQLDFAWDLDADGQFDDTVGAKPTLTWQDLGGFEIPIDDQGHFEISLRVTGTDGNRSEDTTTLVVRNVPPQATILPPDEVQVGESTRIRVNVTDVPSDPLTFEWQVEDGNMTTVSSVVPFFDHTFSTAGNYDIRLVVRDDDGAATEVWTQVTVVASQPSYDFADFLAMAANFGIEGATTEQGDLNNDGTVSFEDFLLLIRNFESADGDSADAVTGRRGRQVLS